MQTSVEKRGYTEYVTAVHSQIQNFIKSTINVNLKLKDLIKDTDEFVKGVTPRNKNQWSTYIDYDYLVEIYHERNEEIESNKEQEALNENIIALFVLLFLVESVLLIGDRACDFWSTSKARDRVHGAKKLVDLLNQMLQNQITLVRDSGSIDAVSDLLNDYEQILLNPERLSDFDISNYSQVKDYLYPLYKRRSHQKIDMKEFYKWHMENPLWFKGMTTIIFLVGSGAYAINEREIRLLKWGEHSEVYDSYLARRIEQGIENAKSSLLLMELSLEKETIFNENLKAAEDIKESMQKLREWVKNRKYKEDNVISIGNLREQLIKMFNSRNYLYNDGDIEKKFSKACYAYSIYEHEKPRRTHLAGKEELREEIRQQQGELIQEYMKFMYYRIIDIDEVVSILKMTNEEVMSYELNEKIDEIIEIIQSDKLLFVGTINKIMNIFEREIRRIEFRSTPNRYYRDQEYTQLLMCKDALERNLEIVLSGYGNEFGERSFDLAQRIIIKHEVILHLQNQYLILLRRDSKRYFEKQQIEESSFYSQYLNKIQSLISADTRRAENELMDPPEKNRLYMERVIRKIIWEALDDYFAPHF